MLQRGAALVLVAALAAGCGGAGRRRGGGGGSSGGAPDAGADAGEWGDAGAIVEGRSEAEVCTRWAEEWMQVQPEWEADADDPGMCATGRVPDDAQDNGLRRVNLYRWLAGLEPVRIEPSLLPQQQECATLMAAMRDIDHYPPETAPCYTTPAATAAGRSNLALGSGLAGSVDQYIHDGGVPSLGHRRWILNPAMVYTAFGYKPNTSCLYAVSDERDHSVPFVAWPPPGPVPLQAALGRWSFSAYGLRQEGPVTFAAAIDDGEPEPLEADVLQGGIAGPAPAWAFDLPARVHVGGRRAHVTVTGLAGGPLEYEVFFTRCAGR